MAKALIILFIFLAVLAGMSVNHRSFDGLIFGVIAFFVLLFGAIAFLVGEVLSLRRRVRALEQERSPVEQAKMPADPRTGKAPQPGPALEAPEPTGPRPQLAEGPPEPVLEAVLTSRPGRPNLWAPLLRFFTQGNPVLKIGLVVLFFGVAFLLKYAAQRNLIPIELRLSGVALAGLGLLVTGWRLRRNHPGYGLGLEGGGIGILYLVVFAAARLYHLLPLPLALVVMIGLVSLSCALAILQDAKGLAVSGAIGGFLAPVLMSTGGGSQVMLFSYYALLNSGILAIAWFKAWRELNLVGFVFTFAIITLWSASAYTPAHFATTEPFLILFFLMYALIAVLFAHRQPLQLRGFIDGPLVFGLPIVASGLQAYLVHEFRYGMALSALALGGWYIGLARLLWSRLATEMGLLVEAFLALGVVFASLAIPLGLDPEWTTAAWALEGAAMIWVGIRQGRRLARILGCLLQLGAALTFADQVFYPWEGLLFANHFFLGCGLLALAALVSSHQLETRQHDCQPWEGRLALFFFAWGWLWWYGGGLHDLNQHLPSRYLPAAGLAFTILTTLVAGFIARRLAWQRLTLALLFLLPAMALALTGRLLFWGSGSLLTDYGWLVWPLAFGLQYRLLHFFAEDLPQPLLPRWHILSLWTLMLVITVEIAWQVDRVANLATTWSAACWGLVPIALLFALVFQGHRLRWPVQRFTASYQGPGVTLPLLVLLLWGLVSLAWTGDPAPLPYLPLLNPLELTELAILSLAAIRLARGEGLVSLWPATGLWPLRLVAGLGFLWLNAVVARTIHVFFTIPYDLSALWGTAVFQAAIAALWSILALAMTIGGARLGQRRLWFAGASLLAMVVVKLFVIDLAGAGTIGRIVSFLVVGVLMLIIGFFAPLPQAAKESP